MQNLTVADWLEIARLIRRAHYAVDEADELPTLYDNGRLSLVR
jgi:hypothetical protein